MKSICGRYSHSPVYRECIISIHKYILYTILLYKMYISAAVLTLNNYGLFNRDVSWVLEGWIVWNAKKNKQNKFKRICILHFSLNLSKLYIDFTEVNKKETMFAKNANESSCSCDKHQTTEKKPKQFSICPLSPAITYKHNMISNRD